MVKIKGQELATLARLVLERRARPMASAEAASPDAGHKANPKPNNSTQAISRDAQFIFDQLLNVEWLG